MYTHSFPKFSLPLLLALKTKAQEHENTFRHSEAEQTDFGKVRNRLKTNIRHILYLKRTEGS